jgi:hypothetical protein
MPKNIKNGNSKTSADICLPFPSESFKGVLSLFRFIENG